MDDLTELYQEIILSHHRNPRHDEVLDPCSHQASGFNPLCGDRLVVTVRKGDIVRAGQTIGVVSDASGASEARLHFEVRRGATVLDPTLFL